jgi:hypothetical protein
MFAECRIRTSEVPTETQEQKLDWQLGIVHCKLRSELTYLIKASTILSEPVFKPNKLIFAILCCLTSMMHCVIGNLSSVMSWSDARRSLRQLGRHCFKDLQFQLSCASAATVTLSVLLSLFTLESGDQKQCSANCP